MRSPFTVTVARERAELLAIVPQWLHLAQHALEPNASYRPAALLRRLRTEGQHEVRFILMWAGARLVALFPFRGPALYRGLPVVALTLERDATQRYCTPLVRSGCARDCFRALLQWFHDDGEGASLLELRALRRDDAVVRAFADVAGERSQVVLAMQDEPHSVTLLVGEGAWGELAMSTLPMLRWAKRGVARALYGTPGT